MYIFEERFFNMKIFINPGHGGTDPGTVSKSGLKESDVTAKVAEILAARLKANWYPVQVFQQEKTYTEVSKEENKSGATLFVSIHCNSHQKSTANGVEVFYQKYSIKGGKLAKIMQEQLIKATGLSNRGYKPSENLHVLNRTKAPAILIELAFISNRKEEKLLREQPEIFANAIWEAIKIYKKEGLI